MNEVTQPKPITESSCATTATATPRRQFGIPSSSRVPATKYSDPRACQEEGDAKSAPCQLRRALFTPPSSRFVLRSSEDYFRIITEHQSQARITGPVLPHDRLLAEDAVVQAGDAK